MPSWCNTAIWSARLANVGPGRQRPPPSLMTKDPALVGADVRHRDAKGLQSQDANPFSFPWLFGKKFAQSTAAWAQRRFSASSTTTQRGSSSAASAITTVAAHRQAVHQNRRRLVQVPRADHPGCVLAETGRLGVRVAVERRAAPAFRVDRVRLAAGGLLVVGNRKRRAGLRGTTGAPFRRTGAQVRSRADGRSSRSFRPRRRQDRRVRHGHRQPFDVRRRR